MKVSIFGLGYVGCVGLACLAEKGHQVVGIDINPDKIQLINNGKSPVVEGEIDEIIERQYLFGNISATDDSLVAVGQCDVSFICVGTPNANNGHLDLSAVFKVAEEIGSALSGKDDFHVVVIRSTTPPGTNEKVTRIIEKASNRRRNEDFSVVSNPEFLREGTAVHDYYNPPYILIGSDCEKAAEIIRSLYCSINAPVILTSIQAAELIKYVCNAYHALKIVFANEVGKICKELRIDSHELMNVFCQDTKLNISPYYFKPGFAYGGSCLPKDLKGLCTIAHDLYLDCPVLRSIEVSNGMQKDTVLRRIMEFGVGRVGFLGLSFKAGTDDLRNSAIVDVIEVLLGKGFHVSIYDKNVHLANLIGSNREYILSKIPYIINFMTPNIEQVISDSDLIVVVNNEPEFRSILDKMPIEKFIYDLVNVQFENRSRCSNYVGVAW